VRDFDAMTGMLAQGDPEKIVALDRGSVRVYWEVATAYIRRLVAEQDRVNKAKQKRHVR
jgi:hypothetical protein